MNIKFCTKTSLADWSIVREYVMLSCYPIHPAERKTGERLASPVGNYPSEVTDPNLRQPSESNRPYRRMSGPMSLYSLTRNLIGLSFWSHALKVSRFFLLPLTSSHWKVCCYDVYSVICTLNFSVTSTFYCLL